MATAQFSMTQQKILAMLSDGQPHPRLSLWMCMPDAEVLIKEGRKEYVRKAFNQQLLQIRNKLRPGGHDIICEAQLRRLCYRHVVLLKPHPIPAYSDTYMG